MMKYVPNIISLSRIVLVVALFFTFQNKTLFLVLYLISGFSDVLDGYIARKTKTESILGAKLDSIADFLLFTVITVSVIIWLKNKIFVFLPLLIIITIIRFVNIAIAFYKYHSFVTLHTWANKFTGFLLFVSPVFILYQKIEILWFVSVIAFLSATEETVMLITSKELNINIRSIFKI